MAEPVLLFQNYSLTETQVTPVRAISFTQDWIGVLVTVTEVTGTDPRALFKIQWSHDGNAPWFDSSNIGLVSAPGTFIKSLPVQGCYWRLGAVVQGTDPVFVCSATALF